MKTTSRPDLPVDPAVYVRLTRDDYTALVALAAEADRSLGGYVRQLVRRHVVASRIERAA